MPPQMPPPAGAAAAFVRDGVRHGEARTFTWREFRELCRQGRKLIVVDGSVLDVEELQDREHKGGAVYAIGTDMTGAFAGAHGNVRHRMSAHRDGSDGKPALTVMENLMEKVRSYTIGYLDSHAGTKLEDGGHRYWVPGKAKAEYHEAVQSSLDAEGVDPELVLAEVLRELPQSDVGARALAAVVGSLVADAAAQPTHWNYAQKPYQERLRHMGRWENPEFLRPSINAFYRVPSGTNSCYGDQALLILESLVSRGACDPEDICNRFVQAFREGGSLEHYGPLDRGSPTAGELPIEGGWRHGSVLGFLENVQKKGRAWPKCGSNDSQADCFVKIVPVVALYAGRDQLLEKVEAAIRVTQDHEQAVAFGLAAARIIEACILGELPAEAVRAAIEALLADPESDDVGVLLREAITPERCGLGYTEGIMDACGGRPLPGLA
mmetsp:Transcript_85619/g.266230  ORF Transcript_85619/g.266230 Transcript_85619/m.266230 type:complete len:437 (+) Transcript_85619:104-1414(+)